MKCINCGSGIASGLAFYRQNEKGIAGIWKCEKCNTLPIEEDVQQVVAEVQKQQQTLN